MIITGLCRFSLVGRGDWQAYRGKKAHEMDAIAKEQAKELFLPERMEARLSSFEHLTLASLKAQTDQDFLFIVMASNFMPKRYRKRLEDLCKDLPQVQLHFFDIIAASEAQNEVYRELGLTLGETIQFRLDDDDCVCVDFIEQTRKKSEEMRSSSGPFAITLSGTLYCKIIDGKSEIYHWPVKFLAAGLSLHDPEKSAFQAAHFKLEKRMNSCAIEDRLSLVSNNGLNDTQLTPQVMKKRGFVRLDKEEIAEKLAVNFPFLTDKAKELVGLADDQINDPKAAAQTDSSSNNLPSAGDSDTPAPDWLKHLATSKNHQGFYISDNNFAIQHTHRKANVLYVGFDDLSRARADNRMRDPWGYSFAEKREWSNLGILAYRPEWFRSDKLITHLERLAKDGFFEEYRKVVFAGVSMGAYAACAFSSLAPNSTVIAFSPQSTLSPKIAKWDKRYPNGTRADWSGAFADAAKELHNVGKAWIIYDPHVPQDQRHAMRLAGPNVELLRARYAAHFSAQFLRQIGVLSTIVEDCVEDRMSPARFYDLYRSARPYRRYLMGVIDQVSQRKDLALARRLLTVLRQMNKPALARDLHQEILRIS